MKKVLFSESLGRLSSKFVLDVLRANFDVSNFFLASFSFS